MFLSRRLKGAGLAVGLILGATTSMAADFSASNGEELNCIGKLSGTILPGDTQKLVNFLQSIPEPPYDGTRHRICLDSPGGSLSEAVKMADILLGQPGNPYWFGNLGTAVPAGARCESACAVLFLSGGEATESDAGRLADRVLHAQGKLGFHAISLQLPERSYSSAEVTKAFSLAVKSMGAVAERMDALRLRVSLLQTMLSTPPESMHFIETIGEAARWNIEIAGLPVMPEVNDDHIWSACKKLSGSFVSEDGSNVANYAHEGRYGDEPLTLNRWIIQKGYGRPNKGGESMMRYEFNSEYNRVSFLTDDGQELGGIGCEGDYELATQEFVASTESSNGWAIGMPNYWIFPDEMRIADLFALSLAEGEISSGTVIKQENITRDSRCRVFKGGQQVDNDPCTAFAERTQYADLSLYLILRFTWPSGGVTVVEKRDGKTLINGAAAERIGYGKLPGGLDDWTNDCYVSSATGNTFCFANG